MKKYFGGFESHADLVSNFRDAAVPADRDILFASYEDGGYDGHAIVVFERDGLIYEVNGYHCSCNGLEGTWEPEATNWEALAMRELYHHDDDARAALRALAAQHVYSQDA